MGGGKKEREEGARGKFALQRFEVDEMP